MTSTRWAVRGCYFMLGFTFASWASRIPHIKTALHLSDGNLGKILFALPVGQLISLQFSGKLTARFGSQRLLPPALMIYALVLILCGLAQTPWQLAAALLLFGLSSNLASIALNTQGVVVEERAGRPLMASFHGAWSLAGFCAGLTGLLLTRYQVSPLHHFQAVAAAFLLLAPLTRGFLLTANRSERSGAQGPRFDPVLLQLGVIGFCSMGTEGCMFDWSGVYFRDVVRAPAELVVLGYTSFMIMMASGRFVGDKVVARFGRTRVLQGGGVLMSAGLALSVLCPSLPVCTLAFMIVGLGVSSIVPTVYSLAGQARPNDPGNALAAVSSVSFLGFLLGPPLIGGVSSLLGLRASFALIACLGLGIPWLARAMRGNQDELAQAFDQGPG